MSNRIASFRMYLSAIFALFGGIAMGCVIMWSGTSLESLKRNESEPHIRVYQNGSKRVVVPEDAQYETWISSSVTLGALAGSLFAGFIIHFIGRRKTLIGVGLPNLIGWACICYARNFPLLITGRCLTGFCAGVFSNAVPVYVFDIATPKTRGFLGTSFQIAISLGMLYEVCFGTLLEWNHLAYASVVPGMICSLGMLLLATESPITLVENGDSANARKMLTLLRDSESDIDGELREIEDRVGAYRHTVCFRFGNIKRPDVYYPAIISVMLMIFQQISGINTIWFYLENIFQSVVVNNSSSITAIILNAAFVSAALHSAMVMNKFGRKMLLLLSGIGQMAGLAVMGYYYQALEPNYGWIPVVCLFFFVVMYSLGFGPIPWMIAGEIVPHEAIPLVSSMVSVTNWTLAFLITKYAQTLTDALTKYGTYWLFAGCSALAVLYTFFFVPETKNRSIEDIQKHFNAK